MNAFVYNIIGSPLTWLLFYCFVITPIWSWRISRAYLKFKNSSQQNEQKFCRNFIGEILCVIPLIIGLIYLIIRLTGF